MKKLSILFISLFFCISGFSQNFSFMWDGEERTYKLHLPTDYSPENKHPLIINMHGSGSNALQQELYSGFSNLANDEDLVVVYPNAINGQWNIFFASGTDDVGFLNALIDTMAVNYNIDLNRVYACGMSMGGFMSYRLACQLDDRIAAIASVTGLHVFSPCYPARPIPILQIHGTDDSIVPYEGVAETITYWTSLNNCPADSMVYDLPDSDTTDQSTVTVTEYFPCNDSSRVKLYTVNGGEHTWPGSPPIIGITNQDIDANVEIWNFFKDYTLEGSTGLSETGKYETGMKIYPNPVTDASVIEIPVSVNTSSLLSVTDAKGQLMTQTTFTGNQYRFSVGDVEPGIYFLFVKTPVKEFRGKIVVN